MFEALFTVLLHFYPLPPQHALAAILDIESVVTQSQDHIFKDTLKDAKLLTVFGYHESEFRTDAVGDSGRSLGVLQVWTGHLDPEHKEAILKDPALGFRLGYSTMRRLIRRCGSVKAGLGAYATGRCGGAPKLVGWRCTQAGLTSECK